MRVAILMTGLVIAALYSNKMDRRLGMVMVAVVAYTAVMQMQFLASLLGTMGFTLMATSELSLRKEEIFGMGVAMTLLAIVVGTVK